MLEVFPNPATAAVQFRLKANDQIATLRLYDLYGKQVIVLEGSGQNMTVDLGSTELVSGAYFYRLRTAAGKVAAGRLVVQ